MRKSLGTQRRTSPNVLHVSGDVRGFVSCDVHVPFHDRDAVRLSNKILKWWQPDIHIRAGDHLDCYGLSRFDKNPERLFSFQDEIDAWHIDVVAPSQAAQGKQCRDVYFPGNHEARLEAYLWRHPELFGIRSLNIATIGEFEHYGIEHVGQAVQFGDVLEVSHGTRVSKWAGASARAEVELRRYGISTITGHVHRAGRFQTATRWGQVVGQEAPCLCSLEPEYMLHPDWVQGVTLFEIRGEKLWIEAVTFNRDYTCMVGGKMFSVD